MSDLPYLMQDPVKDELWLVTGETRLLITPEIYDLLASNGAELPDTYGINELREQNDKLRELLDYMTPIAWYAASERDRERMRELGVDDD